MASVTFPDLPGWRFAVDERSAGVYEIRGSHVDGRSLQIVGYDPDDLLDQARADAENMGRDCSPSGHEPGGELR